MFTKRMITQRMRIFSLAKRIMNKSFCSTPTTPTQDFKGLLNGIVNITEEKYYSSKLDFTDAANIMDSDMIYKAAAKDYEDFQKKAENKNKDLQNYLYNIENKIDTFVKGNEVWDREDLKSSLDIIYEKKGSFAFLLGGKSTGKSLVLKDFGTRQTNVILVDMRVKGKKVPILKAILDNLQKTETVTRINFVKNSTEAIVDSTIAFLRPFFKESSEAVGKVKECIAKLVEKTFEQKDLTEAEKLIWFVEKFVFLFGPMTIVIDEANLAFDTEKKVNKEMSEEYLKQILAAFTALTKQEKMVIITILH